MPDMYFIDEITGNKHHGNSEKIRDKSAFAQITWYQPIEVDIKEHDYQRPVQDIPETGGQSYLTLQNKRRQ
jgi:hypothetical protein